MAPKPEDDLFIEPADDEDVVYGDYNSTMDGASSSGPRPYIRLTSQLRNATREAGGEVRFRCEAVGTPPLNFSWLKNNAPVEKSRRIKIRNKDSSSRLVISELDVLDSGYYQCIASNVAASVNTTSVLRVNNVPDAVLKSRKNKGHSIEDYEDYELMDRGRLPDEEEADLYRVPNDAGGAGYIPSGGNERWLDGIKYRAGDCIQYRGEACRQYLSGRHIMLTSESREDMYDIDRNLRAAMLFINNSPTISQQCRQISQAVACFHMYKVCDPMTAASGSGNRQPLAICKKDCDRIQKDVCPDELALAAQHELVGDGPKALFPTCAALPQSSSCIPVLDTQLPTSSETPKPHWCYTNTGTTYEGAISTTISGKSCMNWEESTSREYNVHRYPELRRAKNNCRNPGGKKTKPWCYSQPMGQEEYCDIQQCPKDMYPMLNETPKDSGSISTTDSIANWWDGLQSNVQLAVIGGGVSLFIFFILLLCCLCCCRAKKKKGKARGVQPNHLSAPPSIVNSAGTSAYYRKLNGTSTPIVGRGAGPMEMAHLLPSQMQPPPPLYPDQFRQHEIREEAYEVRSIPASQIQKGAQIGEGQFGIIHQGRWTGMTIHGEPMAIAIKSVRIDPTNADRASLEQEIRTIAEFDHPHVIKLLGVCYWNNNSMSAIFEYMTNGDLYEFLRLRNPGSHSDMINPDNEDFMRIATQIAYGMEYLASMGFVHRDLATRNCLVYDNLMIKICDFPLMKPSHHEDYYKPLHRGPMPVRWMAKESLESGTFTEATDVWSYGVTLWEIWSYGRQPYEGNVNQQVIEFIANRNLLECPLNCPTKIYSLMVECWHENPDRRPNFAELHNRLQAWSVASPAHSILNPARNSNSSQSGSSMSGRGPKPLGVSQTRQPYNPRGGRRLEDASPLMRREVGNYTYSEDDDGAESD